MGICTDIMHDFVLQEIKRVYSSYDGWSFTPRGHGNGYDTIVTLNRLQDGHREIVKVLVTFKKAVTPDMLESIQTPEKPVDGTVPRYDYAVIVAGNADTSALSANVKVIQMKSFAFDGDNLIWVKKPVRKTPDTTVKAEA